jgi:hypothetical protein
MKALHAEVAKDLLDALLDDELSDVYLTSSDDVQVPACRFVLAARSTVLKRMLYGSFREAKSSTICMLGYDSVTLQAIVDFCAHNDISRCTAKLKQDETSIRQLVHLARAADYLELPGLEQLCECEIRARMTLHPPLACAVYDEAERSTEVSEYAMQMLECRPYVALDHGGDRATGGGIESLHSERLLDVVHNTQLGAGEFFLFRMMERWFQDAQLKDHNAALQTAHKCTQYLQFENIEPSLLLKEVKSCEFVSSELIFAAVAKQALRASQDRVWSLGCRGKEHVERVLVEGAGNRDANGMYYLIAPLANNDLYAKREVACGQQRVYTLSCSTKEEQYECRIFCSTLLTSGAIFNLQSMQKTSVVEPVIQPVLQIIELKEPESSVPTPIRKYYRVRVSDGEVHMAGTLATAWNSMVESKEVLARSICKILQYGLYEIDGTVCIHIREMSIVTTNPGQRFGRPIPLEEADGYSREHQSENLLSLYSCTHPRVQGAKDIKVPRTGWQVDDQGDGPVPSCTWMPPLRKADNLNTSSTSLRSSTSPISGNTEPHNGSS